MVKSIFKEIIIILLLILAILVLLAVLFYDYIPTSKTVPSKVEQYALEPEIRAELAEELNGTSAEEIVKTYQLDATDLEHYEKTKEYNKGKVNPFSEYGVQTTTNTNSGTSGSSSSGSSSDSSESTDGSSNNSSGSTTNDTSSSESTGTFLNVVGK